MEKNRIIDLTGSDNDEELAVEPIQTTQQWTGVTCTMMNHHSATECEACSTVRVTGSIALPVPSAVLPAVTSTNINNNEQFKESAPSSSSSHEISVPPPSADMVKENRKRPLQLNNDHDNKSIKAENEMKKLTKSSSSSSSSSSSVVVPGAATFNPRRFDGKSDDELQQQLHGLGPLIVPLTYDQYELVLELAFRRLGGYEEFERKNQFSGCKQVGFQQTMYGAMYPHFIRDYIERTNLTSESRFIDLGCGIGQFVMQVALTLNCKKALGVEIESKRYDASLLLRDAIYTVLGRKVCFQKVLFHQVDLKKGDMLDYFPLISKYTHIFFNNYGTWFTTDKHDRKKCINHLVEDALSENMAAGGQVVVLGELCAFSSSECVEMLCETYQTGPTPATFHNDPISAYRYVNMAKVTKGLIWNCGDCTTQNKMINPQCYSCQKKRTQSRTKPLEKTGR